MMDFTDPYKFDTTVKLLSLVPTVLRLQEENEKLKERLDDADKALKAMDEKYGEHYTIADGTKMGNSPAWKYMLKWGVK